MSDNIKYGIIGAGTMGREHIRNIDIIDEAEVVALSDTNSESLNQSLTLLQKDIPAFNNHHDLINANLADAYIVATPNFTHLEILKDITKSNAHLLIEKPLCTTLQDCKEIANLTMDYPGIIWTAMEYRYMPPIQKMIREIHNKTIGKLQVSYNTLLIYLNNQIHIYANVNWRKYWILLNIIYPSI